MPFTTHATVSIVALKKTYVSAKDNKTRSINPVRSELLSTSPYAAEKV